MGAILIKSDKKNNKILSELAQRLGGAVLHLDEDQYEDIVFGITMENVKTGELVDREKIMEKLSEK